SAPSGEVQHWLPARPAVARLALHLVLATWRRRGVFAEAEARAVAAGWQTLQRKLRFVLLKVSFVPDHVHLAVRVHPAVVPASLVAALMNGAEETVFQQFPEAVIGAGAE